MIQLVPHERSDRAGDLHVGEVRVLDLMHRTVDHDHLAGGARTNKTVLNLCLQALYKIPTSGRD